MEEELEDKLEQAGIMKEKIGASTAQKVKDMLAKAMAAASAPQGSAGELGEPDAKRQRIVMEAHEQ
jgi:hypothetical protein